MRVEAKKTTRNTSKKLKNTPEKCKNSHKKAQKDAKKTRFFVSRDSSRKARLRRASCLVARRLTKLTQNSIITLKRNLFTYEELEVKK
jgi:hypothetical protein